MIEAGVPRFTLIVGECDAFHLDPAARHQDHASGRDDLFIEVLHAAPGASRDEPCVDAHHTTPMMPRRIGLPLTQGVDRPPTWAACPAKVRQSASAMSGERRPRRFM